MERIKILCEDTFGPASKWSMNEVLLIMNTVVEGIQSKTLSTMVSSYMGKIPFLFNTFRDTVVQYAQRIPTIHNVQVNAISIKGFKCEGRHFIRDCKVIRCSKCSAGHNNADCKVPAENLNQAMGHQQKECSQCTALRAPHSWSS